MKKLIIIGISWIIVPLLFIVFWLFSSLFLASKYSFTVLVNGYNANHYTKFQLDGLHKGDVVSGYFQAKENNLGIVAVRFNTYDRINTDQVVFRIKEEGNKDWYYQNSYKVDQFQPNELFTFGFPPQSNSKGKEYVFQIQSVKGYAGNAVAVSPLSPAFVVEYQIPKAYLLSSQKIFITFLFKKIVYSFSDINFAMASLTYLIPLLLYFTWLIYFKKRMRSNNFILFFIFLLDMFSVVLFMNELNGPTVLLLLLIWIILIFWYHLESSVSYLIALVLLALCTLVLILGNSVIAENAAIWAYYFLMTGTLQVVYELWRKPKNLIPYNKIVPSFFGKDKQK